MRISNRALRRVGGLVVVLRGREYLCMDCGHVGEPAREAAVEAPAEASGSSRSRSRPAPCSCGEGSSARHEGRFWEEQRRICPRHGGGRG